MWCESVAARSDQGKMRGDANESMAACDHVNMAVFVVSPAPRLRWSRSHSLRTCGQVTDTPVRRSTSPHLPYVGLAHAAALLLQALGRGGVKGVRPQWGDTPADNMGGKWRGGAGTGRWQTGGGLCGGGASLSPAAPNPTPTPTCRVSSRLVSPAPYQHPRTHPQTTPSPRPLLPPPPPLPPPRVPSALFPPQHTNHTYCLVHTDTCNGCTLGK